MESQICAGNYQTQKPSYSVYNLSYTDLAEIQKREEIVRPSKIKPNPNSPELVKELVNAIRHVFEHGLGTQHRTLNLLLTITIILSHCQQALYNAPLVWLRHDKDFPYIWLLHFLRSACKLGMIALNYENLDQLHKANNIHLNEVTQLFTDPMKYDKRIQKYLETCSVETVIKGFKYQYEFPAIPLRIVFAEYPPHYNISRHALILDLPHIEEYPYLYGEEINRIFKEWREFLPTFNCLIKCAFLELWGKSYVYSSNFSIYVLTMILLKFGAIEEPDAKSICEILENAEMRSKRNFVYNTDENILRLVEIYLSEQYKIDPQKSDLINGFVVLEKLASFITTYLEGKVSISSRTVSEILNQNDVIIDRTRFDLEIPEDKKINGSAPKRIQRTAIKINEEALHNIILKFS